MGNLFGGKAAKKQAAATVAAAQTQAAASDRAAEANRQAAEQTAAALREQSANALKIASDQATQSKLQADAAAKSAAMQADLDREAARGAQLGREGMMAQQAAADKAAELLQSNTEESSKKVEVTLADTADAAEVDPETGRRRPVRASFMSNRNSGIRI